MRRREFITLLGAGAAAWPLASRAQQPDRVRLIGVLMAYAQSDRAAQSWLAAFRGALSKLGWTEGSNLRIELRWSADDPDRIRALAKELVDLRPNAIFGVTTPVIHALARLTKTIPIVFAGVSDPIGSGLAANLAHPGGNITGFMASDPAGTLGGKWVELLMEIAPRTVRGAISFNSSTHLPPTAGSLTVKPVMLPPGCARFAAKPLPIGSVTPANTMGIVRVSRASTPIAGVL